MEIEIVKSKDKYSFSLWFDKELNTEHYMFRKDGKSGRKLSKIEKDGENIIVLEREFGSILMDCFNFAQSDTFHTIKSAAESLADIVRQGRGKDMYEPFMEKLFRIYNNSSNPIERAVVFMIWYQFRVKHDEMFATKNALSKKQWKRIGSEYEAYIEKLFAPFSSSINQIRKTECDVTIGISDAGGNLYIWHDNLLPLYMIYLPLLEREQKHILTCKECGKQFIAKRIDTQVCSDECRRTRQRKYNQMHTDKINSNPSIIAYKELRQRFLDFEKTLKENKMPKEMREACVDARKAYEQEFDDVFKRYKANWTTLRAVNNCINRYSDKLDKMIAAVGVDSGTEVTL